MGSPTYDLVTAWLREKRRQRALSAEETAGARGLAAGGGGGVVSPPDGGGPGPWLAPVPPRIGPQPPKGNGDTPGNGGNGGVLVTPDDSPDPHTWNEDFGNGAGGLPITVSAGITTQPQLETDQATRLRAVIGQQLGKRSAFFDASRITPNFDASEFDFVAGTWSVAGGQLRCSVLGIGTPRSRALWNLHTYFGYTSVAFNLAVVSAGRTAAALVRWDEAGQDGYELQAVDGTTLNLYRIDNWARTLLDTAAQAHVAGDEIRLTIRGSTLRGYHNGTSVVSATDATYAAGAAGLGVEAIPILQNVAFDLFDLVDRPTVFAP